MPHGSLPHLHVGHQFLARVVEIQHRDTAGLGVGDHQQGGVFGGLHGGFERGLASMVSATSVRERINDGGHFSRPRRHRC